MAAPVDILTRIWKPSASFTRPADTTQYAVGDLVANNTAAASVQAMPFDMGPADADGNKKLHIAGARLHASKNSVTAASFRLHLYSATPTFTSAGDNSAYGTVVATGNANWIASFDVTLRALHADGASGIMTPTEGAIEPQLLTGGNPGSPVIVYGLLEALDVYTPSSGETFSVRLLVEVS
jgi:hypothetical protein